MQAQAGPGMRPRDAGGLHNNPALAVRAGPARPEWCSKTLLERKLTAPEAYEQISESARSGAGGRKRLTGKGWTARDKGQ